MKKLMIAMLAACFVLVPVALVAQEVDAGVAEEAAPTTPPDMGVVGDDPGAHVEKTIAAWQAGDWSVAVGLTIMLLIWIVGAFVWTAIPKWLLPWLSMGLGMVATVAMDLAAGGVWWRVLLTGLTTGASAAGFWSLVGKHTLGKIKKSDG